MTLDIMQITEHLPAFRGSVELVCLRGASVLWRSHSDNLIVTVGKDKLAKLLGGQHAATLTQIGIGTSGTAATVGDTTLTNVWKKALDAKRYSGYSGTWYGNNVTVSSGQIRCEWLILNAEANGISIREFGLLFSDDTLFARYLRPNGGTPDVILKQSDMTLAGAWTINVGV